VTNVKGSVQYSSVLYVGEAKAQPESINSANIRRGRPLKVVQKFHDSANGKRR